jgi:hypothetical protein
VAHTKFKSLTELRDAAPKVWKAVHPVVESIATSFIKEALRLP